MIFGRSIGAPNNRRASWSKRNANVSCVVDTKTVPPTGQLGIGHSAANWANREH
jgi:hypothetical protein